MKLNFIDKHKDGYKYDGVVVSLNAKASFDLEKDCIEYKIPEDYYDLQVFNSKVDDYFISQYNWIKKLDEFLYQQSKEIRELEIKPAQLYGYFLKVFIDPVVIYSKIINYIIDSIKPFEIIHYRGEFDEIPLDYRLGQNEKTTFCKLLPIVCKSKNIPYVSKVIKKESKSKRSFINTNSIKGLIYKYKIVKFVWNIYKGNTVFFRNKNITNNRKNYFFLNGNWGLNKLSFDALKKGNKVFNVDYGSIYEQHLWGKRKFIKNLKNKSCSGFNNRTDWNKIADVIKNNKYLIGWINEQCNLNVSTIFLPKFLYFITNVCPELINYGYTFKKFYKDEKIDYVITPHKYQLWEFSAMEIATQMKNIKSIQITHGYQSLKQNATIFTELPCNILFTLNKELKRKHEYIFQLYNCDMPNVITVKSWLEERSILKHERVKLEQKRKNNKRKRIVFIPTIYHGAKIRFDSIAYPETWYNELQKAIVNYLNEVSNYDVIYKDISSNPQSINPTGARIAWLNLKNVTYSTKNLLNELKFADRVIMDYPSTPMIEALAMGVPTLVLYHASLKMSEFGISKYGRILQQFREFSDCKDVIQHFLNANEGDFVVSVIENDLPTLFDIIGEI